MNEEYRYTSLSECTVEVPQRKTTNILKMPNPLKTTPRRTNTANNDQLGPWWRFCFNRSASTTTQVPVYRRRHHNSLKGPESQTKLPTQVKKAPLNSRTTRADTKPNQKLNPPITWCQNPKIEKSGTDGNAIKSEIWEQDENIIYVLSLKTKYVVEP